MFVDRQLLEFSVVRLARRALCTADCCCYMRPAAKVFFVVLHVPLMVASLATVSRDFIESLTEWAMLPRDTTDSRGKEATTTSASE